MHKFTFLTRALVSDPVDNLICKLTITPRPHFHTYFILWRRGNATNNAAAAKRVEPSNSPSPHCGQIFLLAAALIAKYHPL